MPGEDSYVEMESDRGEVFPKYKKLKSCCECTVNVTELFRVHVRRKVLTVTVLASISVNMNSPPSKSPFRYNSALKTKRELEIDSDQFRSRLISGIIFDEH